MIKKKLIRSQPQFKTTLVNFTFMEVAIKHFAKIHRKYEIKMVYIDRHHNYIISLLD